MIKLHNYLKIIEYRDDIHTYPANINRRQISTNILIPYKFLTILIQCIFFGILSSLFRSILAEAVRGKIYAPYIQIITVIIILILYLPMAMKLDNLPTWHAIRSKSEYCFSYNDNPKYKIFTDNKTIDNMMMNYPDQYNSILSRNINDEILRLTNAFDSKIIDYYEFIKSIEKYINDYS